MNAARARKEKFSQVFLQLQENTRIEAKTHGQGSEMALPFFVDSLDNHKLPDHLAIEEGAPLNR